MPARAIISVKTGQLDVLKWVAYGSQPCEIPVSFLRSLRCWMAFTFHRPIWSIVIPIGPKKPKGSFWCAHAATPTTIQISVPRWIEIFFFFIFWALVTKWFFHCLLLLSDWLNLRPCDSSVDIFKKLFLWQTRRAIIDFTDTTLWLCVYDKSHTIIKHLSDLNIELKSFGFCIVGFVTRLWILTFLVDPCLDISFRCDFAKLALRQYWKIHCSPGSRLQVAGCNTHWAAIGGVT